VEDGELTEKRGVGVEGVHPEAHGDELAQVVADPLRVGVYLGDRGTCNEEEDEQDPGYIDARLAQVIHPFVDRRGRRDHVTERGNSDYDELQADGIRDAEGLVEPRPDLDGAKPQRDGDAEQGGYDRHDVYDLPDGTVYAVAEQGVKDRADQVGAVPAEVDVCHGEADDGIDPPRV
jgi:hypothetical protein